MLNALKRFYLWGIDGRLRYEPVMQLLREHGGNGTKILELGSGPHGLTLYWPRPVVGYDTDFWGPDLGWLQRVNAEEGQRRLPFEDGQFDFVVSMDMLEHLPSEQRRETIREMIRVSRGWVVITCPCDAPALECDESLVEMCKRRGVNHRWAAEHLARGLPEASEVERAFRQCMDESSPTSLEVHGQLNTGTWRALWRFTMARSALLRSLLNKMCWPLVRRLSRKNEEPTYRKVFILRKLAEEPSCTTGRAA